LAKQHEQIAVITASGMTPLEKVLNEGKEKQ